MALSIRRTQVWSGEIPDRPGAAAAKLEYLVRAGAELEFVFTRPNRNQPDTSRIFLAPISGTEQLNAARAAGLAPAFDVAMLIVEGDQRPGICFELMSRLAIAGINLSGISISSIGRRFVAYLAFDNVDVATMAVQVLVNLEE